MYIRGLIPRNFAELAEAVPIGGVHVSSKASKTHNIQLAENGFAPAPREFCRHILSYKAIQTTLNKRCLHCKPLCQPVIAVTCVTISD